MSAGHQVWLLTLEHLVSAAQGPLLSRAFAPPLGDVRRPGWASFLTLKYLVGLRGKNAAF